MEKGHEQTIHTRGIKACTQILKISSLGKMQIYIVRFNFFWQVLEYYYQRSHRLEK